MSPALKAMMTPGRGDHSNGVKISQHLCFGTGNPYLADMEDRMNRPLQILIAATCVIVLICGGVWLAGQNELRREAAHDRAAAEMVDRLVTGAWVEAQKAKAAAKVKACADALDAYDARNETFAFVDRVKASGQTLTGDAMLAEVAACREIIRSSTPSAQPE